MLFFCKKHSVCLLIIQKQHKCLIFKQFYNILFFCKLSENQYFSATEEQQKTIKIHGMLWYDDRYHLLRNISVILIRTFPISQTISLLNNQITQPGPKISIQFSAYFYFLLGDLYFSLVLQAELVQVPISEGFLSCLASSTSPSRWYR